MSGPALEDLEIPQIDWGNGGIRLEPCPKRVRVVAAGQMVVDSRRVTMMLEPKHLPVYYFPREHVRMELLIPAKSSIVSALKGPATYWTLRNGDRIVPDAFFSYDDAPSECPDLSGLIGMYWGKMDAVFEEEEEVFTHAREPHHRIEVLRSSRQVRVAWGSASSPSPTVR